MSATTEHRKLAAIMFTDMVGYSAMVERDEAVALRLLEEHRQLLRSIFARHEGSEIKTIGDGFLVEFSSALAAVRCGVEIQEAIARRNSANPSEGNFQLRIGIHAGDVVHRADDVIGDGVNIAARIVPLAEPGGICISRQVFEQVENRLASSPKKMGQVKVKNMIRPLEVYWVGYEGAATAPRDLVQGDTFAWAQKSIAVLPFLNMSSDPENEYLSDGLTEDLILAFSQLKGLRVPARTSSFAFKGKQEDIRRIGEQLNVTKVLEGSVRKAGDRLRITAQLINVADGDHLWAQTFDRQLQDVFAVQDEITRAIVRALEMQLIGAGDQPLAKHGTYNTDAYQLYLQARYHFYKFTGDGFRRSIECCKKALEIDPTYALAYAALSLSYQTGWFYGFLSFEEKLAAIGRHDVFAEKAVELDPNLAESQTVLGIVRCWNERDWRRGEECFKRAIELNPNYVTAHEHYGGMLACLRRTDEALNHARIALRIDPLSPMINVDVGLIYWILHRNDLLLEQAQRLLDLESNFFGTYWLLAWAHWCQGMRDAAVADLRRALALGGGPIQLADLGCFLGLLGRKAEAQQALEDLNELGKHRYVQPAYRGFVHASLGNLDEAFACFTEGVQHENASIAYIGEYCISAGLDDLCADPRFPAFLKQIGLGETSRDQVTGSGNPKTSVKEQLLNSATDVGNRLKKCPRCGAAIQNDQRTCMSCLLREGLEAKGQGSREAFESVLAQADVTDAHWRLGHYEILEEIGRGGMGVIYRARQRHSRRIVAVKRILAHQVNSHETLVRFRREAEAVASLDHPNILPIHEVSESEEGLPFFSMKYAIGGSLRAAASALRSKPRECVRLMAKVARAISYAHTKGIVHRDLQPGNILLDENGEPMVSDFGLAKWLDQSSDLTRTLETLGTPGYIAPEQTECLAADLTPAADVYSLGAILFYLLTGRPPFVGPNVLHVIHQAASTPAPRLRSLAPSLDRDLETIVARCLESDPRPRYRSAAALAEDLEHWLRHEPIRARRSGIFIRGRKWVRRNPTSTALVASLIALGAVIGVMSRERESIHSVPSANESIPFKSIAVLPFENLSADRENAFFADGVQAEILNDLAKIADLKTISRTSVMPYKAGVKRNLRQIANELGVAHVVEGSVQRAGNRVRVSAQLIDAKTDVHLWAERYDRPLGDVFAIQSDIAKAIAGQLRAKLSPAEKTAIEKPPTTNLIAYDRYLRAEKLWAQQTTQPAKDIHEIIRLLDQAVANDPAFLLAHCELARTHAYLYFLGYDHTPARIALAEEARNAALPLGPDRGEPHLAAAYVAYWCYHDYEAALTELDIARRRLPNDAAVFGVAAGITRRQGHWEECLRNYERAIELDPRNLTWIGSAGLTYEFERRFPEATAYWDRALAVAPDDPTMPVLHARLDLEARADTQPRHEAIQSVLNKDPSAIDRIADQWFDLAFCRRDAVEMASALASLPSEGMVFGVAGIVPMPRSFLEGLAARVRKDATGAEKAFTAARVQIEKIVREQPDYAAALCGLGMIDAALGHKEDALREGRRAVELLPITRDAMAGAELLTNLAIIYAWAGEKEFALKQLEEVVQIPSLVCYGRLRLDPSWDPLRGDPRFEKLVEESKKPVAMN
jgi:adenylate cyclase